MAAGFRLAPAAPWAYLDPSFRRGAGGLAARFRESSRKLAEAGHPSRAARLALKRKRGRVV